MKQLTFSKRIEDSEFWSLEKTYSIKLPQEFKDFMQIYANSGTIECIYIQEDNGQEWELRLFCNYKMMHEYVGEFLDYKLGVKIPFGHDLSGWLFCLCLDEQDYYSVYIYRFDYEPEEAFFKIADNFEDFINALVPEEEN
jgi:SMI1-KNR4 cell-wall